MGQLALAADYFDPYSNPDSYLQIFKGKAPDDVGFHLHQTCDYEKGEVTENEWSFFRYLVSIAPHMRGFMRDNQDKTLHELNEVNWSIGNTFGLPGEIRRARFVKLKAGGQLPWHRDETSAEHIRVICPLITNDDVVNAFEVDGEEVDIHMPADGSFYCFDERVKHAVFNNGDQDRYTFICTVLNTTLEEWDAKGY